MKKLYEKIEFLIYLCQQIHDLLKAAPDTLKSLAAPQIEYMSLQDVADKCFIKLRQAERYLTDKRIEPSIYFGARPYFARDYVEEILRSGELRRRKI